MTKPTLIQSLLNLPSQSYSFPHERQYHSTKAHMIRVAAKEGKETSWQGDNSIPARPAERAEDSHPPSSFIAPTTRFHPTDDDSNSTSSSSSEKDVFYTPNASPRASTATDFTLPRETPTIITASQASMSTLSFSSDDKHSLFSSDASSPSTRATTPHTSDAGHGDKGYTVMTGSPTNGKASSSKVKGMYTDEDWANDVKFYAESSSSASRSSTSSRSRSSSIPAPLPSRRPPPTNSPSNSSMPPPRRSAKTKSGKSMMSKTAPSIMMSMTALIEEDEGLDGGGTPGNSSSPVGLRISGTPKSQVLIAAGPVPKMRSSSDRYGAVPHASSHTTPSSSSSTSSAPGRRRTREKYDARPPLARRRSRSLEDLPSSLRAYQQPELPSQGTPGYTSLTLPRAPAGSGLNPTNSKRMSLLATTGTDGKIDLTRSGLAQTTMASVEVIRGLGGSSSSSKLTRLSSLLGRKKPRTNVNVSSVGGKGDSECILGFTSYRKPPDDLPGDSVLVQIWGVGLDGLDMTLVGVPEPRSYFRQASSSPSPPPPKGGFFRRRTASSSEITLPETTTEVEVGYIPGRSFAGRVLACGWEVNAKEEVMRKGDWVIGLLDIKKCGALQEFIVVDRHRVHHVPHPLLRQTPPLTSNPSPVPRRAVSRSSSTSSRTSRSQVPASKPTLSLEELSLLPVCGVLAYRAVRTILNAFPSSTTPPLPSHSWGPEQALSPVTPGVSAPQRQRRALVLHGHDGVGAMAVQMLVKRGWKVAVHAPLPPSLGDDEQAYMRRIENRVRGWGGAEVVFDDGHVDDEQGDRSPRGAVVRAIERLVEDADVFDAVLDTVGGKDVWEASEKLLSGTGYVRPPPEVMLAFSNTSSKDDSRSTKSLGRLKKLGSLRRPKTSHAAKVRPMGQFTTIVGDFPERPVPTAGDLFRAGLRSMKNTHTLEGQEHHASTGKVGYAWVSVSHDVDLDGDDVRETIRTLVKMALEENIRPFVPKAASAPTTPSSPNASSPLAISSLDATEGPDGERSVPFERVPRLFVPGGPLRDGRAIAVRVVE